MAVLSLLQFIEALQLNLKAAIKEDSDWYKQFIPLSEMVNFAFKCLAFLALPHAYAYLDLLSFSKKKIACRLHNWL